MKTHNKLSVMLKGKKRYAMLALVCVEFASLPAAAQIVNKVVFQIHPIVTAVEIPNAELGFSRFIVASNSGFTVEVNDLVGAVNVSVKSRGTLNGLTRFGDAAQLPGELTTCSQTTGFGSPIYIADKKTAARPGTATEQAVIFEFRYSPESRPSFAFKTGTDAVQTPTDCVERTT